MSQKRIVVVGGTAAGPKAAARAKRLDQSADVVLLQKAPELSMASCGYPYYVAGDFKEREKLLSTPAGVCGGRGGCKDSAAKQGGDDLAGQGRVHGLPRSCCCRAGPR